MDLKIEANFPKEAVMFKKTMTLIFSVLLLVSAYGCVALLAGAAGGTATASWLSGKLTQEVNAPFERSIKATKSAVKALRLELTKETTKESVAQVMANYTDGRAVWIDIHRLSPKSARIDVRVGMAGDKEAARKILNKIIRYL